MTKKFLKKYLVKVEMNNTNVDSYKKKIFRLKNDTYNAKEMSPRQCETCGIISTLVSPRKPSLRRLSDTPITEIPKDLKKRRPSDTLINLCDSCLEKKK
jgi:hypothetical protein